MENEVAKAIFEAEDIPLLWVELAENERKDYRKMAQAAIAAYERVRFLGPMGVIQ
jgi:hypothetical protein